MRSWRNKTLNSPVKYLPSPNSTLLNVTSHCCTPSHPNVFSDSLTSTPFISFSIKKAVTASILSPHLSSIFVPARTRNRSAFFALMTNDFLPFNVQSPPLSDVTAVVLKIPMGDKSDSMIATVPTMSPGRKSI